MSGAEREKTAGLQTLLSSKDSAGSKDRLATASTQGVSDEERGLVQLIQEGDHVAFELLFKMYYGNLYNFAIRYVRLAHIAEELVQDVFFDIWVRRENWHPHGSVKAYLYRAMYYKSLDHFKHARVVERWVSQHDAQNDPQINGPEESVQVKELRTSIEHAIDDLPNRRRLIFLLTRNHGLTYAEAASALGISINTVEVQMGRALKFLRDRLAEFLCVF